MQKNARDIPDEFRGFLPLFSKIDTLLANGSATVAIEGGSASGKTTLARFIKEAYDCNVFHTDDFFLRPEQRTRERLDEIGGNLDRERFFDEIILPTSKKRELRYRKFNCHGAILGEEIFVLPKKLTVIEGVYSMHLNFSKFYDFSVFLDIDKELQKKRIINRNPPDVAKRFFNEWIPLEDLYFSKTAIKHRCDLSFSVKDIL